MSVLKISLSDPTLRLLGLALLFMGAFNSSVYPQQSLIGIRQLGLSEPVYSAILVLASAVAVTTSVLVGILNDRSGNRRRVAIVISAMGLCGAVLMLALPGRLSFALTHGILLPAGSSLYGQIFALMGLAALAHPVPRDAIQSTVRAALSISFLGMMVFWTFALNAGLSVMSIYVSAAMAGLGLFLTIRLGWPRDGATRWQDAPSGLNMRQALREITHRTVLLRLLCMGAISASGGVYMVLISLVFSQTPERGAGDVALYVGLVAGWEIPAMLALPWALRLARRTQLIAAGAALYALHLIALPFVAGTPFIWVGTLFAGIGGTAFIALPIAYFQDLLVNRPGTAAALLALQKLVADVLVALIFASGTALGGYGLVASLAVAISLAGATGLILADRRRA